MKATLVIFALVCVSMAFASRVAPRVMPLTSPEYQFLFKQWMVKHEIEYDSTPQFDTRFAIFKDNLETIRKHMSNGERSFDMALNKFGDLTPHEFKDMYLSYVPRQREYMRSLNTFVLDTDVLPASVDWVTAGKVTAVKDQGQCVSCCSVPFCLSRTLPSFRIQGSCWAFSTTGSTEAAYAIENNCAPISLSEQELVDCSQAEGNEGCSGGLMDQGFEFIIKNGGLCSETAYPYKATDNTCAKSTCKSVVTIGAFTDVPKNNESALQAAVAQQPVSVAVDAESWQFYSGGVLTGTSCGTSLDHGVLLVGYGTTTDSAAQAFWKVKNSWGGGWGESGYIRIGRGTGSGSAGTCGIAMDPSYPTGVHSVSMARLHRVRLH